LQELFLENSIYLYKIVADIFYRFAAFDGSTDILGEEKRTE